MVKFSAMKIYGIFSSSTYKLKSKNTFVVFGLGGGEEGGGTERAHSREGKNASGEK